MTTKDTVGYTLSGGNAHAQNLLEQALHQFRCFADNPLATAEAALAEAPDLVMAQVLRAWLYLLSSEAAAVVPAREALRPRASCRTTNARPGTCGPSRSCATASGAPPRSRWRT